VTLCSEFKISAEHSSLSGHFPGAPVVPGVVILDEICDRILRIFPDHRVIAIPNVKFAKPLLPGETACMTIESESGVFRFRCSVGEHLIASGTLQLAVRGPL
jgi:3-hydroxyacyl-[acyl-carrier-protein] dehydratase